MNAHAAHIDQLIRRGRDLRAALGEGSVPEPTLAETRIWQRDCASTISHLSGGSKAHWLSRRFSEAFLVRSQAREAVEQVAPKEIVDRILTVLGEAASSVSRADGQDGGVSSSGNAPHVQRFDFVHNPELRPILEQAFVDSRRAFDEGSFGRALILSCGILETLITDALEHGGAGPVGEWSFDERIAAAELKGLIRGGCARLPPAARHYRDLADRQGDLRPDVAVTARDARLAAQVLQIVKRDLDPGR